MGSATGPSGGDTVVELHRPALGATAHPPPRHTPVIYVQVIDFQSIFAAEN
jgi:hypothetical protein